MRDTSPSLVPASEVDQVCSSLGLVNLAIPMSTIVTTEGLLSRPITRVYSVVVMPDGVLDVIEVRTLITDVLIVLVV